MHPIQPKIHSTFLGKKIVLLHLNLVVSPLHSDYVSETSSCASARDVEITRMNLLLYG